MSASRKPEMSLSRRAKITTAIILSKLTTVIADSTSFTRSYGLTDPTGRTYSASVTDLDYQEGEEDCDACLGNYNIHKLLDAGFSISKKIATSPDHKDIVSCPTSGNFLNISVSQNSNEAFNQYGKLLEDMFTPFCASSSFRVDANPIMAIIILLLVAAMLYVVGKMICGERASYSEEQNPLLGNNANINIVVNGDGAENNASPENNRRNP